MLDHKLSIVAQNKQNKHLSILVPSMILVRSKLAEAIVCGDVTYCRPVIGQMSQFQSLLMIC